MSDTTKDNAPGGAPGLGPMLGDAGPGMLAGLRVIEIADERAE